MNRSKLSVYSLFSGSGGNCTYISCHGVGILIDAGASVAAISRELGKLGTDFNHISAVFITHEHTDHIRGISSIAKKFGIPIHFTEPSARKLHTVEPLTSCITVHPLLYSENVPYLTVRSFVLPHDSAACVGYRVTGADGDSCAVATDLGTVTKGVLEELVGCRNVILECNHDTEMLANNQTYPRPLKKRIQSVHGHLSNDECAACVAYLAENGTENVMLAHISAENNTPQMALDAVTGRLTAPIRVVAAKPDGYVMLTGEEGADLDEVRQTSGAVSGEPADAGFSAEESAREIAGSAPGAASGGSEPGEPAAEEDCLAVR